MDKIVELIKDALEIVHQAFRPYVLAMLVLSVITSMFLSMDVILFPFFDYLPATFLAAFLLLLMIGVVSTTHEAEYRPALGMVYGFISGIFAFAVGGIPYYAFDYAGVAPNDYWWEKMLRLSWLVPIMGTFTGMVNGFIGLPVIFPKSKTNDSNLRSDNAQSSNPIPKRLLYFIFSLMFLCLIMYFIYFIATNYTDHISNHLYSDGKRLPDQGNIAYWQLLIIIGVFQVTFVSFCVFQKTNYITLDIYSTPIALYTIFSLLSILSVFGIILSLFLFDCELTTKSDVNPGNVFCRGSTGQDVLLIRLLLLVLWTFGSYLLTVPHNAPIKKFLLRALDETAD